MNDSDMQEGWERVFDDRLAMAVLLMFVYAGIQLAAGLLLMVFAGIRGWDETQFYAATTLPMLTAQALCLFLVWRNLRAEGGVSPDAIGIRRSAIKSLVAIVLVFSLAGLMLGLESLYEDFMGTSGQVAIKQWIEATAAAGIIAQGAAIIGVVAGAPIVEEFIFRGYLQSALMDRVPAIVAVGCSAFVFAAFHMDIEAFPLLFFGGLLLGLLYQVTRSLWPPLALHMLINLQGLAEFF